MHMASSSSSYTMKLSLTFVLLLSGLVVFGDVGVRAARPAVATDRCATIRCSQGGYITCDNYGDRRLDACHCVCAPPNGKGCVLHLNDRSTSNCTETNCK